MAWRNPSERGIGRGEVAESQIEAPIFTLMMGICAAAILAQHLVLQNNIVTVAAAISLFVFATTIVRVEYGLYILLTAMLLSPEIEAGSAGRFGERGINIRADDVLIMVIFIGVMVKHAFEGRPLMWRPNPVNAGIFAYYGSCLLSSLLALRLSVEAWDKDVAFFVLLKMLQFYLVFFMVGMAMTSMDDIRRQLKVFFGVSLIVCAYGVVSIGTQPRVSAPFEAGGTEPNTLGGYLLVVICVALGLAFYAPVRRQRLLFYGLAAIAFFPVLMTLSRATYAALFVALAIMALAARRTWLMGALVVAILAAPFVMPEQVIDRVQGTFEPTGVEVGIPLFDKGVTIDKSAYERVYVWRKVRHNLSVWPIFGGGVSWETVLDSQFARVLIETGLVGFAAFLFLLYRILITSRQTRRWSRDWVARGLGLSLFATTIGLIVHSFATISFLIVRIMEPFWFLMALVAVSRQIAILDHSQRMAAPPLSESSGGPVPAPIPPSTPPRPVTAHRHGIG